ncbi:FtsK/SpoIIIE domain-containing protein [Staphylococcus saprophyticus]|nr:FtsK/SpoIIIE domain-containing protein [Staphylococcus saprophyticus]
MASRGGNHYPYASISRMLWKLGKYIIILLIAWYLFFNVILNVLSLGLMKLANSDVLQKLIDLFNGIIGSVGNGQIPSAEGAGEKLHKWVLDTGSLSNVSILLWLLLVVVVLYLGTILLRHHYREQAPFINDIEAKWLKIKMPYALGSKKNNKNDNDKKVVREDEKKARKYIRKMKVYINTRKDENEAVPTKEYFVLIKTPTNDDIDEIVLKKIKNMPKRLRQQTGGVIFGDMERTEDGNGYYYKGSKEAKVKEARSVRKNNMKKNNNKNTSSEVEKKSEKRAYNPTFPLELFVDKSAEITNAQNAANKFAEETEKKLASFFSTNEYSANHQKTEVGNSSVLYRYSIAYSKNRTSEDMAPRIQKELSDALEIKGVLVSGAASIITITVPLKEGDKKHGNLKYDYTIPIDVANMISQVSFDHPTTMILGITADNKIIHMPLSKQPHLLIAGETGSGKSVTIQEMLITSMHHSTPEEVQIGIIDPKEVDFQFYDDLPYMITNPVVDMSKAATFMEFVVMEMEKRKSQLKRFGVRNVDDYNEKAKKEGKDIIPYWIIVIDEYADLVGEYPDVAPPTQRIAQKARANGIHLILGMQTPRADILKGAIKANVPARIAMKAASSMESNIILDENGAEKLNLAGDMLVKRAGTIERAQSAFISDDEITNIFNHLKEKFDKPVFPDYERIVARAKGELEEDDDEGVPPKSVTVSTNANRKRPTTASNTKKNDDENQSVKGDTEVSTSKSSLEKLRERANKQRQLNENKINNNTNEQKTSEINV